MTLPYLNGYGSAMTETTEEEETRSIADIRDDIEKIREKLESDFIPLVISEQVRLNLDEDVELFGIGYLAITKDGKGDYRIQAVSPANVSIHL